MDCRECTRVADSPRERERERERECTDALLAYASAYRDGRVGPRVPAASGCFDRESR